MSKNLIVHIGAAKTGTSIIRNFLRDNLEILNKNDFFPLLHKCNRSSHDWIRQPIEDFLAPEYSQMLRTILACTMSMCREEDLKAFTSILDSYNTSGKNIIMTSDFFSLVKNPELLLKPAQKSSGFAILYVKSQLEIIENLISELVLDPAINFEQAVQYSLNYDLDFEQISKSWSNIENFQPCKVFSANDGLQSFISALNLPQNIFSISDEDEPKQLPSSVVSYLYTKKGTVDNKYWLEIVNFFKKHPNILKITNSPILTNEQQQFIILKYEQSNLNLLKTHPHLDLHLSPVNYIQPVIDLNYLDKVFNLALQYSKNKLEE